MGLHEIIGTSIDVQELLQSGRLILDDRWFIFLLYYTGEKEIPLLCLNLLSNFYVLIRGLRCSWDGLALLDSMLPSLLLELETQILQKPQRGHQADGQTEKTSNPRWQ